MNAVKDVSIGDKAPQEINVIIEISKGSNNKYELDKETGLLKLDRVLYSAFFYPADYGFAPQTLWDDGDPLDVLVVSTNPLPPLCLVTVRPVAIMDMIDSGEGDAKVIAVPVDDPRFKHVQDLKDLNPHFLKEMEHFFAHYKDLQGKKVEVQGFKGKADAIKAVEKSQQLYKKSGKK